MAETAAGVYSPSFEKTPVFSKKISWDDFQRRFLLREDRFKYEWVNGYVQKTPRNMDESQAYIFSNLNRFLYALKSRFPQIDGDLIAESDTFFAGNHRRPDIAYYSGPQLKSARAKEKVHLDFVIEIISKRDQMETVLDKMEDYRKAEVKVIWHVFPKQQQIHVYHGKSMTICTHEDMCSAEPVIKGFVLPVAAVFQ